MFSTMQHHNQTARENPLKNSATPIFRMLTPQNHPYSHHHVGRLSPVYVLEDVKVPRRSPVCHLILQRTAHCQSLRCGLRQLQEPIIICVEPLGRLFTGVVDTRVPSSYRANIAIRTHVDDGYLARPKTAEPLVSAQRTTRVQLGNVV